MPGQVREQRQLPAAVELRPVACLNRSSRIHRLQRHAAIVARLDRGMRPQADGGVQRERAVVKEVQRPDVDGAAREIDARRRGGNDPHSLAL